MIQPYALLSTAFFTSLAAGCAGPRTLPARFLYLTREPVYGLGNYTINAAADRFDNVQDWAVRLGRETD